MEAWSLAKHAAAMTVPLDVEEQDPDSSHSVVANVRIRMETCRLHHSYRRDDRNVLLRT